MKPNFLKLLAVTTLMLGACSSNAPTEAVVPNSEKILLKVFAAGSLIIPFADLEEAFESRYPNIDVQAEYHGSIQVIRHATELHEEIDVVATADASLIPMLMYINNPETGSPYAGWYIRFATNQMALAYSPSSKYADEITVDNWPEILARPDVKVGFSDPRFDALGYRALMAYILEEKLAGQNIYFNSMFKDQFTNPVTVFRDEGLATVTVPEILETRSGSHIVLRGASIQLVALLESGDIDYAFEYESVIRQHNLPMLRLPDAVNLGADGYEDVYNKVVVELDFQRFASVKPVFSGERIGYGITIPANAPHPEEAALFIAFLLGPEGRTVMEANYHPMFDPAIADRYENLPVPLQPLTIPMENP
jgi:molybdate/tungstate transport system substrate-binding protein